jgi:hypothetical protein
MQADREKRPAAKVMWCFPIIPHLKRLFAIAKTAKLMRWHAEDRVNDGKLWHPADGAQWMLTVTNTYFDHQHFTQKHGKVR